MICHKSDTNSISLCVDKLLKGEVLILPTDTVYGFSGIVDQAFNTDALIRKIKGRDENKPMIQLIASPEDIYKYTDDIIPSKLLSFWPGPLTIIVNDKRFSSASENITTAFRCPGDLWLRNIIRECNAPVYSTSVNRSGSPVLETEEQILSEFEQEVGLVVLNGNTKDALPSTIVKLNQGEITVLREGAVKIE